MSRLLHAAARHARIEWLRSDGVWRTSTHCVPRIGPNKRYPWRIHPDDAHLQYGPISTALRVLGQGGKKEHTNSMHIAWTYVKLEVEDWSKALQCEHTLPLLALILAEALADEGM